MFTVVPLAPRYDNAVGESSRGYKQRHHPDVQGDVDMELDDVEDDDEAGPSKVTAPGEAIASSAAVLRCVSGLGLIEWLMSDPHNLTYSGHGTYIDSEEVVASVTGIVERVNKLITVRALKSRCV